MRLPSIPEHPIVPEHAYSPHTNEQLLRQSLPPATTLHHTTPIHEEKRNKSLPKTYLTRKGAMLIYSDTITLPKIVGERLGAPDDSSKKNEEEDPAAVSTLDSLVKSILKYGSKVSHLICFINVLHVFSKRN